MNHDLSYLRSEYAREKDIECYLIEEKEAQDGEISDESRQDDRVVGERDV